MIAASTCENLGGDREINNLHVSLSHSRSYRRSRRVYTKGQGACHFMAWEREALTRFEDYPPGPPWVRGIGNGETDGYFGGVWCMWGWLAPGGVKQCCEVCKYRSVWFTSTSWEEDVWGRSTCILATLRDGDRANRVRWEKSMPSGGSQALEGGYGKGVPEAETESVGEAPRFNRQAEDIGLSHVGDLRYSMGMAANQGSGLIRSKIWKDLSKNCGGRLY